MHGFEVSGGIRELDTRSPRVVEQYDHVTLFHHVKAFIESAKR